MRIRIQNLLLLVSTLGFATLVLFAVVFRPSWGDEGAYLDPGANLSLGRGFVSTCWDSCAPGAVWGSATPGFPLLFWPLFEIFGFGLLAPRCGYFFAHLLGAVFVIRWAARTFGMSNNLKIGCFFVMMGAPSLSHYAIYSARLECVALLICAAFLYLKDSWANRDRFAALGVFLLGLATVMMGLHFVLYLSLAASALFLLEPSWSRLRFGLMLAAGMLVSACLLRLAYGQMGVWEQFIAHRSAHFGRELPWVPTGFQRFYITKDLGIYAVGCFAVLCWDALSRSDEGWKERTYILSSIVVLFFAIPLIVGSIGIWHAGYSWMLGVPMLLGTVALFRKPCTLPLRCLAALGLLMGLAGAAREIRKIPRGIEDDAIRKEAVADLRARIKGDESIASTFDFYFELRKAEPMVFFRCEHESRLSLGFKRELYFPEWAQAKTHWLLASESEAPAYLEGLGGGWIEAKRYTRDDPKGDYVLFRRKLAIKE